MIYEMKLRAEPFEQIISGKKTVELRLFDKKRRKLDIGDRIIFENKDQSGRRIAVVVKSLHRYATFEELFMELSPRKCGFTDTVTAKEAATKMNQYYSADQIREYGVLGIGITMTDIERALYELEEQKEG